MIVATARASDATIVTLRTSPMVRARRPGDQSPACSGICLGCRVGAKPGARRRRRRAGRAGPFGQSSGARQADRSVEPWSAGGRLGWVGQRQGETELGPAAVPWPGPDPAALDLEHAPADRQPDPDTARVALGLIGSEEGDEEPLGVGVSKADSPVEPDD